MPQQEAYTVTAEEQKRINKALLMEAQGKLTAEQQKSLDSLRDMGIVSSPRRVKPPVVELPIGAGEPKTYMVDTEETIRQGLPIAGAMAGSMLAPGLLSGVVGAGIGAAAGESAGILSDVAQGKPVDTSTIAEQAALGATGEGIGRGLGWLGGKAVGWWKNRLNAKNAADLLSKELSSANLSAGEFATELRSVFDATRDAIGAQKGSIVSKYAKAPVSYTNTLKALDEEIATLSALQSKSPTAFKNVEGRRGLGDTLESLKELRQSIAARGGTEELAAVDKFRSESSKIFRQLEPSESSRISGKLNAALRDDITSALPANVAQEYLSTSARYAEMSEMMRKDVLKRILGSKKIQVSSDKVVALMATAPGDISEAIGKIAAESGNQQIVQNARRAIFEETFRTGKLPALDTKLMQRVFGNDTGKVAQFAQLLGESTAEKGKILGHLADRMRVGKGGVSIGVSDLAGNIVLIPEKKMANILSNPKALDDLLKLMQQPTDAKGQAVSKWANNTLRSFWLLIKADESQKEVTPEEEKKQGYASIMEQLQAKGQLR